MLSSEKYSNFSIKFEAIYVNLRKLIFILEILLAMSLNKKMLLIRTEM